MYNKTFEPEKPAEGFNSVTVGCGCKSVKDVLNFINERRVQYAELAWADEMGLWHTCIVSTQELNPISMTEGIPCGPGMYLTPDPLSARIAPFSHPNIILLTCTEAGGQPETRSLKTKQINPGWIEVISKQFASAEKQRLETPKIPADIPNENFYVQPAPSPNNCFIEWKIVKKEPRSVSPPQACPSSPPFNMPSPSLSPSSLPSSPGSPNYGYADSPGSPPGHSVPGSPSFSPRSPSSPDLTMFPMSPNKGIELDPGHSRKDSGLQVPPLLRPRQVHPTKAHKLGVVKPIKKRRNTENLFCRHCGTTDTPEWRRGPDGRKSLCNACGLYYSKMIKRETLVVPQSRRCVIGELLNPTNP